MSHVNDVLEWVDHPHRHALTPGYPADDALITLLVHMAYCDGTIDKSEHQFLCKLFPDRKPSALAKWFQQIAELSLDLATVAVVLPQTEDRWKALRFVARMAYKDGIIHDKERQFMANMVQAFSLPSGALDRVIQEIQKRSVQVEAAALAEIIKHLSWDSVKTPAGALTGELRKVVPKNAVPVARILLEGVEVMGVYQQGLAASFLEGNAWIPWNDIVTYTRVGVLGAAMQVHTEVGRTWTLVDTRLRGLGLLLDRIFPVERPTSHGAPIVIKQISD